ncbi:MAG TPA: PEP-CTERM sorting domain-containing protein [Rubrivivax sp.]|nr:PEP-CTERM sorting domain-containing protein [Rubrivivax sp.]
MGKTTMASTLAGACLALMASGPAQAAASASAEIGHLVFTLIDLDPLDGIDPAMMWGGSEYSQSYANTESGGWSWDSAFGWYMDSSSMSSDSFGSASGMTGSGGAHVEAEMSGSPVAGVFRSASGSGYFSGSFTVTPWTGIVVTAPYTASASTTLGDDGPFGESAEGGAYLHFALYTDDGREVHYVQRYAGASSAGESNFASGTVRLTFANLSADAMEGYFSAQAYANASSAHPVPEPASAVMMLAGLLGVGAALRRRREGRAG